MAGFKLDDNGDIARVDGNILLLTTYQEAVKQRLQIKLRTFKGEWWLDTSYGIPYHDTGDGRSIIGKGYTKADVDSLYLTEIKQDPDVIAIDYFNSTYNGYTRQYDLNFEVKAREGNLRLDIPSMKPWEEVTYTYSPSFVTSSCNLDFLQFSQDLHPVVHDYLNYGATFGWLHDLDIGLNTHTI
jgi:hypothetical protein